MSSELPDEPSVNLLQSDYWSALKSEFGWRPFVVTPSQGPWVNRAIRAMTRYLGPMALVYVPYAPPFGDARGSAEQDPGDSAQSLVNLGETIASQSGARPALVRFDLNWPTRTLQEQKRFRRAPVEIQPDSTVVIDLLQTEDQLLASMHKKTRYNIGLAERRGVTVRCGGIMDLPDWYELYRQTAERDRISIHEYRYYERILTRTPEISDVQSRLYLAEHDGDLLAGIIIAATGRVSTYLYGASSNQKRNLMASYALQWAAMRDAKESGAATYDMFGIPPADDENHRMHGLYRFKTGFGGTVEHHEGAWDVVLQPGWYGIYRSAERLRALYHHRLRKRNAR